MRFHIVLDFSFYIGLRVSHHLRGGILRISKADGASHRGAPTLIIAAVIRMYRDAGFTLY